MLANHILAQEVRASVTTDTLYKLFLNFWNQDVVAAMFESCGEPTLGQRRSPARERKMTGEDLNAATAGLASRIRAALEHDASRMFAHRAPLPWVAHYICQDAVEHVLHGAMGVLAELNIDGTALLNIPECELADIWIANLQSSSNEPARDAPRITQLQYATIKSVAGGARALTRQAMRNRHLMEHGPPCGVREFPTLASSEKTKVVHIPANSANGQFQAYTSHLSAMRRLPCPRSTAHVLQADTSRPALYS